MQDGPGNPTSDPYTVLVVDDDCLHRELWGAILSDQGYRVQTAEHGVDAFARVTSNRPDLILLDVEMPVMDGPTFAHAYQAMPPPHAPIIVLSGNPEAAGSWPTPGPVAVFHKTDALHELLPFIASLLLEVARPATSPSPLNSSRPWDRVAAIRRQRERILTRYQRLEQGYAEQLERLVERIAQLEVELHESQARIERRWQQ